ncbi:MAG: PIN-like domain-containing protein [Chitinophagales bacterium]|nr:PIN-like domain-containing protein [Chitinophagales bacterium]
MKDLFHGHYRPTKEEFKNLWHQSTFAFDANIYLNLYRYSEATRTELLKVMTTLKEKSWLPYQAAEEYFRNRLTTTGGQSKEYDKVIGVIDELVANLGNKKRHPFISDLLYKELTDLVAKIKSEFEQNKNQLLKRIHNDEILEKISQLFQGKVGSRFHQEDIDRIYKEGKLRYEAEIPPGFKDGNKDASGNLYRKFGDLIIWKELIKYSKENNKSIIFITDDKKDDWWLEYSGQTIGPLPILIQEFKQETGHAFYMYTADRFMEAAKEYLQEHIEQDVIVELKEFRQQEEELRDPLKELIKQRLHEFLSTQSKYNITEYKIASEEEILSLLLEYEKLKTGTDDRFTGLKNFVTTFVAERGFEINHAYATINTLHNKGVLELYDEPLGNFLVKAIKLR